MLTDRDDLSRKVKVPIYLTERLKHDFQRWCDENATTMSQTIRRLVRLRIYQKAGIVMAGAALVGLSLWRTPVVRKTCKDFPTYRAALLEYSKGAMWLDGDGDGRPCEGRWRTGGV